MTAPFPVRLGPAEQTLIDQLNEAGAPAEAERLAGWGLPTRKVEAYHYTDLKALWRKVPARPSGAPRDAGAPTLEIPGAFALGIVNGMVQPSGAPPAGVQVGTVPGGVLDERDDVLVRLNGALTRESLRIEIEGTDAPVLHIDRRAVGEAGHVAAGVKVFVADGARATLIETYGAGSGWVTNEASHVTLGQGSTFTHITVDLSAREATHFATHAYEIAGAANLRTLAIHAGAGLARTLVAPHFGGGGAHADFTGLNLADGEQHLDITLDVAHAVPNTSSRELFKQVGRGRARAVFQGRIVVARDAQKTDAKMNMQGLMLTDEAEVLSKPELEIYADDVVCGHGSTCGALDEQALFYLMSRGIPKPEAERMIVRAFLAELFDPITEETLRETLVGIADDWLGGGSVHES
jgi:Fe-S cluster assembly protein SufD